MNQILQLKGRLQTRPNAQKHMGAGFPKGKVLKIEHIDDLLSQLNTLLEFWKNHPAIHGALISVRYNQIVAKSNRISTFLSSHGLTSQDSVRGVRFRQDKNGGNVTLKHVFTHYVPLNVLEQTIIDLSSARDIIFELCGKTVDASAADHIRTSSSSDRKGLSKNKILGIVRDALYVESMGIDTADIPTDQDSIVSIFNTGIDTKELLSKFGISIFDDRILNGTTLRLYQDELQKLVDKAPYLISMGLTDFRKLSDMDAVDEEDTVTSIIPHPTNEPVIGVIDTQFDESVYFHEWVEYKNMLDPNIEIKKEDCRHGTAVTSIIVDGPRGNPRLDDGCGRFRVRHFGVSTKYGFSSFAILKMIREIVVANRDIHVWNLSLGSAMEISDNYISPEGAELDALQREFDIIFVVAGTNVPNNIHKDDMKIGAPADSLNSIVVNAVTFDDTPASYTRQGPVLSFFNKPDLSYYGGDGRTKDDCIVVCRGLGEDYVTGTSYAAPWIARKLAYLIEVIGLRREIAKALLVDAAAGWGESSDKNRMGYGIVPVDINKIVHSEDDEIRFVITGFAEDYETYTYQLPVPLVNDMYPYVARVTMAYFPYCNRSQGVDYTGTEMDIHFGRVKVDDGKQSVHPINGNRQGDKGMHVIYEADARRMYRKWDNIKHIVENVSEKFRPRKTMGPSKLWGLSIKTKERKQDGSRDKIPFGVVVTLKEMNGINRIDDFIQRCEAYEWIVNPIDVQTRIDIYAHSEEEIQFE